MPLTKRSPPDTPLHALRAEASWLQEPAPSAQDAHGLEHAAVVVGDGMVVVVVGRPHTRSEVGVPATNWTSPEKHTLAGLQTLELTLSENDPVGQGAQVRSDLQVGREAITDPGGQLLLETQRLRDLSKN